jgi:hypothetical protein
MTKGNKVTIKPEILFDEFNVSDELYLTGRVGTIKAISKDKIGALVDFDGQEVSILIESLLPA